MDGSTTLIIQTPAIDENAGETIESEALEEIVEAQAETEQVETVSDAAVQIAEIEAAARIAETETRAAVELAAIEAQSERNELERENSWLREQTNLMEQRLTKLEALLIPPPSLKVEAEAMDLETITPETQAETLSEMETEAPAESAVESLEAEVAEIVEVTRPKRRAI